MDTFAFPEGVKVQCYNISITLLEEARPWYESLRPINVDWLGLKISFCSHILKKKQKQ